MYMPDLPGSSLVETQKVRAINCGVTETDLLGTENIMRTELMKAEVIVDALLGFSQWLPLPVSYMEILRYATGWDGLKISLDMPTGIISDELSERFPADIICTLAVPKKILFQKAANSIIYLADLGIPKEIYAQKGITFKIPFEKSPVFTLRTF
jgi:NAD(P)H-hydrate repair Nnr-like enzyme with NAD(P)H-hydrate epimerase domain